MLELLRIKNLALIEDAELEFSSGMNTLTGETGAGKSFILRAVDFIMGQRMDRSLVRPGAEKATVEALFVLPDGDCIIRRELTADTGRSRVYINDKLSSQDAVKELRPKLIIHTSQHGQQKLLSPAFQSEVLDTFLPDDSLLRARAACLEDLRSVIKQIDELDSKCENLNKQREFLEFQKREIDKINPQPGEEDMLEQRKSVLKDRERAGECLRNALDCIHGDANLLDAMSLLSREMDIIARMYPEFEDDRQAVDDFRLRLHELDSHLRRDPGDIESDFDDMTLDDVESRLFKISQLKRKLGRGLGDICELYRKIDEDLSFLDACELDRTRLKKEEAEKAQALSKVLDMLNKARQKAARELCLNIEAELGDLGRPRILRARARELRIRAHGNSRGSHRLPGPTHVGPQPRAAAATSGQDRLGRRTLPLPAGAGQSASGKRRRPPAHAHLRRGGRRHRRPDPQQRGRQAARTGRPAANAAHHALASVGRKGGPPLLHCEGSAERRNIHPLRPPRSGRKTSGTISNGRWRKTGRSPGGLTDQSLAISLSSQIESA